MAAAREDAENPAAAWVAKNPLSHGGGRPNGSRFLHPRPCREEACNPRPELSSHMIGVGSFALVHALPAGLALFTTTARICQGESEPTGTGRMPCLATV